MNIYVPNFDSFKNQIDEFLLKSPNDMALQQCKHFIEHGFEGSDSAVYQLSEDCSNIQVSIDNSIFGVVQLHTDAWSYPDSFFSEYHLVITLNFEHTRIDVFCASFVDPSEAHAILMAGFEKDGLV